MKYSTQIRPITYLKSHAAEIVKTLSESGEPLLITQNGEAKLVVMDLKTYEEQQETLALLKLLALGTAKKALRPINIAQQILASRLGCLMAQTPGCIPSDIRLVPDHPPDQQAMDGALRRTFGRDVEIRGLKNPN